MLINDLCLAAEALILLATIILTLILLPYLYLVCGSEDAFHIFFVVIGLHDICAALTDCAVESRFQRE